MHDLHSGTRGAKAVGPHKVREDDGGAAAVHDLGPPHPIEHHPRPKPADRDQEFGLGSNSVVDFNGALVDADHAGGLRNNVCEGSAETRERRGGM